MPTPRKTLSKEEKEIIDGGGSSARVTRLRTPEPEPIPDPKPPAKAGGKKLRWYTTIRLTEPEYEALRDAIDNYPVKVSLNAYVVGAIMAQVERDKRDRERSN